MVVRCEEVGMAQASDEQHLAYAVENGLTLITSRLSPASLHSVASQPDALWYLLLP